MALLLQRTKLRPPLPEAPRQTPDMHDPATRKFYQQGETKPWTKGFYAVAVALPPA
jgi:hypothetical protein